MNQISQCDLLSQRSREKERIVNRQFGLTSGGFEKKNFSIWLVCSIMLLPIVWQSCCTHTLHITFVFNNWKRLPFLRADFCRLVVALFCFSLQFQSPELILIRVLFFLVVTAKFVYLVTLTCTMNFRLTVILWTRRKKVHTNKNNSQQYYRCYLLYGEKKTIQVLSLVCSRFVFIYIFFVVWCAYFLSISNGKNFFFEPFSRNSWQMFLFLVLKAKGKIPTLHDSFFSLSSWLLLCSLSHWVERKKEKKCYNLKFNLWHKQTSSDYLWFLSLNSPEVLLFAKNIVFCIYISLVQSYCTYTQCVFAILENLIYLPKTK